MASVVPAFLVDIVENALHTVGHALIAKAMQNQQLTKYKRRSTTRKCSTINKKVDLKSSANETKRQPSFLPVVETYYMLCANATGRAHFQGNVLALMRMLPLFSLHTYAAAGCLVLPPQLRLSEANFTRGSKGRARALNLGRGPEGGEEG